MRNAIRRTILASFMVILGWSWAAVGVAEAAITPVGEMTFLTRSLSDASGRLSESSSYPFIAVGAEAHIGDNLTLYGRVGSGTSGDFTVGARAVAVERNNYRLTNVGLTYALRHGDGFHYGPVFDYAHVTANIQRGPVLVTDVITGPGLGAYVRSTLDDLNVTVSYVHRFLANASTRHGTAAAESAKVFGNTVEIKAAYPLSERYTLTGGYVLNTEAIYAEGPDAGRRVVSSGLRIGIVLEL